MKPLLCILGTLFSVGVFADSPSVYAARLYERIVGVPPSVSDSSFHRMVKWIESGDRLSAAQMALKDPRFYSVRLRNFAAAFSNIEESPNEDFNDLQALIIGIVRDDLDARLLLTADFRYQGTPGLGLPKVSLSNNDHYVEFERRFLDPWRDLVRLSDQWPTLTEAAGALTTRAWAKAHYSAGTNRRAVKFAYQIFHCSPIESWRYAALPDSFVRRDVDRAESGNPLNYQQNCRGCHAPMDSNGGAFARFDFVNDTLLYTGKNSVAAKMNQNGSKYPQGFVSVDDYWNNFLVKNPNLDSGWRGPTEGYGIVEFGKMLANAKAFSVCMVKRIFRDVCGRAPSFSEKIAIQKFADDFENDHYRFKNLFAQIAVASQCDTRGMR